MCRKLICLIPFVLVFGLGVGVAAGNAYPAPLEWWTYFYAGDAAAGDLDGTWDHDNGSDQWDGSEIGAGNPGGVSVVTEGDTTYVRLQEPGDPTDYGMGDPSNRKLFFTHQLTNEISQDVADQILSAGGITISFRARIATGDPLDDSYPNGGGAQAAWPAGGDGYGTHNGGKSIFGVHQEAGGDQTISFALALATEELGDITNYMGGKQGLLMNSLNGTSPTGAVDAQQNEGTPNILELDPTQWHEFWITVEPDQSGTGTHLVKIYLDGSFEPHEFYVTAGNEGDETYSYIHMGLGSTDQSGAIDADFFAYKEGAVAPDDIWKASSPDPPDGTENVIVPMFQWTAGYKAVFHDVYMGTDPTLGPADYRDRQSIAMYWHVPAFIPGATYYWRVDGVELDGTTIHTGDVWSFTVPVLTASNPSPPDGATYMATDVDLSWDEGYSAITHDVYFGTDEADVTDGTGGTFKANQPITGYDPGTLAKGTTYYWRIDEVEQDNSTKHAGEVWSFTTVPDIPITNPDLLCWWKFDEGVGNTAVDWSGHDNHGTLVGPPQWVDGLIGGALEFGGDGDHVVDTGAGDYLNGLDAVTFCLWIKSDITGTDKGFLVCETPTGSDDRDIRYDSAGGTTGGTNCMKYGITTTDANPEDESPSDTQTTEWQHVALAWSSGSQLQLYLNGVLTVSPQPSAATTGTLTGYTQLIIGKGCKDEGANAGWDGLVDDVRVYNKALTAEEIKDAMRGDPLLAWNPKPAKASTSDIDGATPLSWSPGDKASKHDVYLGTDKDAVADADTTTTGIYRDRRDPNTYTPPEGLEFGQTYYWRIDEFNTDATITKGMIWTFTVAEYLVIDDFEPYDDDCNRIFYTWPDGWGHSGDPACGVAPYGGNGSGSTIGYLAEPYAEQTIVHEGGQSMPFEYLNDGSTGQALYSETERAFDPPQDWTRHGVKALTLWFRGYPASVGSFSYDPVAGIYTMTADGSDISGTADEFHYAYKRLSGVGSIQAQVLSVQNTDGWAKAGVMIRETLDANSVHAMVVMTPANGVALEGRTVTGEDSFSTNVAGITAPYWVKLTRTANTFTGEYSTDGSTWETIVATDIPMAVNVYIGLALTSHNAGATCTATFSDVSTTGTVTGIWQSQDIGITSNDAEQLYVAVEDSTGKSKVVNHVNPNAVLLNTWQQWDIDLKEVRDAGVNLQSVRKMYIGVGDRNTPKLGGGGMLYIDDIRLYPPRCFPRLIKPASSFNDDCVVDYLDLQMMANDWLLELVAPSDAGLVAHYQFEANLSDISSYTGYHNGSPGGQPAYAAGVLGQAISLDRTDGSNDYVDCGNPSALNFGTGDWSICAWVKTTQAGSTATVFANGGDETGGVRYTLGIGEAGPDGVVTLTTDDNTDKVQAISSTTISDDQWHHVVGLRNGTAIRVYVDGWLDGTNIVPVGYDLSGTSQHNAYVGAITDNRDASGQTLEKYFIGLIDDLRIYDYALSRAEVGYLSELSIDLNDDERVDFKDYAILAEAWLDEILWP